MSIVSGTIVAPVSLADIKTALGANREDLGTLAQYPNHNIWAKYKSFAYPADFFNTTSAYNSARSSKNCGLVMRNYGKLSTLYSAMIQAGVGVAQWRHDVPQGNNSNPVTPFRQLDYEGYNSSAGIPFGYSLSPNPAFRGDTIKIDITAGIGSSEITASDIQASYPYDYSLNHRSENYRYYNINDLNVGVAFGLNTDAPTYAYTAGTLSDFHSPTIQLPSTSGNYYAVTFFTDKTYSGSMPLDQTGTFIPAPVSLVMWKCSAGFGFQDAGTDRPEGLSSAVRVKVKALHAISYQTLGVQVTSNSIGATGWSTTYPLETTDGTLGTNEVYTARPQQYVVDANAVLYRMVVNGSPDSDFFPISSSPQDLEELSE